jgi:MFS family permease
MVRLILILLLVIGAYGLVRYKRMELVDFVVPRTAALRFVQQEPLYRGDDGHYQYKYLPAFAIVMIPFTWVSKEIAQFAWFSLTILMVAALVRLSLRALPEQRLSSRVLVWLTLLVTAKFLIKELAFGQFNLPVALLLLGAVIAAQHERPYLAGGLVAAGIFVKPYALVLVPWLAISLGWRPFPPFLAVAAVGLLLPAVSYGWNGNLRLVHDWYRTVSDTTAPNLLLHENVSFASMWAKWIGVTPQAAGFALASVACAMAVGLAMMVRRQRVAASNYLEGAYFCLLIPLLSPQGWDYVLVIALPAYMCLLDRWRDLSGVWRAVAVAGLFLTSFTVFDLLGRGLYTRVMQSGGVSVGAIAIAACLVHLRWRRLA